MEKSVTWQFDTLLRETFQLPEGKPGEYSPLALAYMGDAIYDLIIRTLVVGDGNRHVNKLHKDTSALVQASAQSRMMEAIEGLLTEEEQAVYRRGRNAKSFSTAKNQSVRIITGPPDSRRCLAGSILSRTGSGCWSW